MFDYNYDYNYNDAKCFDCNYDYDNIFEKFFDYGYDYDYNAEKNSAASIYSVYTRSMYLSDHTRPTRQSQRCNLEAIETYLPWAGLIAP